MNAFGTVLTLLLVGGGLGALAASLLSLPTPFGALVGCAITWILFDTGAQ